MPVLDEFKYIQNISNTDFVNWRNEEYEYLSQVAVEPASDAVVVAYIELLEKLRFAEFICAPCYLFLSHCMF